MNNGKLMKDSCLRNTGIFNVYEYVYLFAGAGENIENTMTAFRQYVRYIILWLPFFFDDGYNCLDKRPNPYSKEK